MRLLAEFIFSPAAIPLIKRQNHILSCDKYFAIIPVKQTMHQALIPRLGHSLACARSILRIARTDDKIITFIPKGLHLVKMGDVR